METEFRPTRCRAALGAALGVTTFAIGIALFPRVVAAQTTLDCLGGGPQNTPAWALLSEGAKSRICAGQPSVDRRVADQRDGADDGQRWSAVVNPEASRQSAPPMHSTPTPSAMPRLADDEKTLVLMEEIRAPQPRQPEVRLTVSETSGLPQVQIAGASIAPLPTIVISCARGRRSVSLSAFATGPRRNVASYEVSTSTAQMARDESTCHIAVAGVVVSLPREMVAMVWSPGKD
jgi:hypothetical protein